jgi:hypothetical protein
MEKDIKGLGADQLKITPQKGMKIENDKIKILVLNGVYDGLIIGLRVSLIKGQFLKIVINALGFPLRVKRRQGNTLKTQANLKVLDFLDLAFR